MSSKKDDVESGVILKSEEDRELFGKIREDRDFINAPDYNNSLKCLIDGVRETDLETGEVKMTIQPSGRVTDRKICSYLMITPKELKDLTESAFKKLRVNLSELEKIDED